VAAFLAIVPAAQANENDNPAKWFKPYEVEYLTAYDKCWEAFKEDCGSNLVDDGNPSQEVVVKSTDRINSWLNPPEPVVYEETSEATVEETTTVYSGGAGSSTVQCESGGDYGAYDPSGTYWGGWQFDQQTWNAYAPSGEWGSATPAEQDAAAAAVPYDAWPNC
jgi:hypothetical protein